MNVRYKLEHNHTASPLNPVWGAFLVQYLPYLTVTLSIVSIISIMCGYYNPFKDLSHKYLSTTT